MTNVSTKVSDERLRSLLSNTECAVGRFSGELKYTKLRNAELHELLRELLSYREQRNEFKLAMWLLGADDMYLSEELLQRAEKILADNPGKSVEQLCAEMLFGPPSPEPKAELKEEETR